jgi:hypothetical protein
MPPRGLHIASPVAKWFLVGSFVNCDIQAVMQQKKSKTKKVLSSLRILFFELNV